MTYSGPSLRTPREHVPQGQATRFPTFSTSYFPVVVSSRDIAYMDNLPFNRYTTVRKRLENVWNRFSDLHRAVASVSCPLTTYLHPCRQKNPAEAGCVVAVLQTLAGRVKLKSEPETDGPLRRAYSVLRMLLVHQLLLV